MVLVEDGPAFAVPDDGLIESLKEERVMMDRRSDPLPGLASRWEEIRALWSR